MQGNVVFDIRAAILNLFFDALTQASHPLDVFRRGVLRGHLCDPGLEHKTNIDQIKRQPRLILDGPETERIRQTLRHGHHIGAGAPAHLEDAFADEQLHRLADRTPSDAEALAEFKFIRQLRARLERRIQDVMVELILYLLHQQLILQVGKFTHIESPFLYRPGPVHLSISNLQHQCIRRFGSVIAKAGT